MCVCVCVCVCDEHYVVFFTNRVQRYEKFCTYANVQQKKRPEGRFSLGCHAVDVAREHGTFFDVGDAKEAGRDALQADSEASVRGHAVLERIEIEMERIGVHATTDHLLTIVGFFMDTLSAGSDLEASHKEVEAECQTRVLGVVHRVESTVLGGEVGDEDEIGSVFVICIFANCPFFLRREVIFTTVVCFAEVVLEEDLMHFAQFPCGNLLGQYGVDRIEELELMRTVALYDRDDMAEESSLESHDIFLTFDEAHLDIEGDVLIEVTGGSMFLCAVGGSDLEDALIDAYADLLIELRGLREVHLLAEIIHLEDVRAAFCSFAHDLRSEDLGEAVGAEELTEGTCDSRLYLEDRHIPRVAEGDLTVIELIAQQRLFVAELKGVHVHYLGGCRAAQDADLGYSDLNGVVEGCRVFDLGLVDRTGDGDGHFTAQVVHGDLCALLVEELRGVVADYGLQQTTALTEDDEPTPLGDADVVDHAGNGNRFANLAVGEICYVSIMLINV